MLPEAAPEPKAAAAQANGVAQGTSAAQQPGDQHPGDEARMEPEGLQDVPTAHAQDEQPAASLHSPTRMVTRTMSRKRRSGLGQGA